MEFDFKARTRTGTIQKGSIDSPDLESAIDSLQINGLVIISINPKKATFSFSFSAFGKIKTQDVVNFSRQLAVLFSAKSPLVDALRVIGQEMEKEKFKTIIFEIAKDVEAGLSLSRSLAKYPTVFNDFYVNLVKAGESVGKLEDTLNYIADYLERQYYLIQKAKSAFTYPAFVVVGLVIAAAVMLTFVVPQITSILEESDQELPFITVVIVGASNFMRQFWYLVFGGLAILIAGAYYVFTRTKEGRIWADKLQLKLPIFKDIFRKIYLTRIAESLNTLIQGGLPLLQALDVTGDIVSNIVYRDILKETSEVARRGGSISSVFKRYPQYVPTLVTQMVLVGESSGRLDFVLEKVGSFYQKEVVNIMDNLVSLIEPILILVLGVGVGVLIVAILLPIYNLATTF